MITQIDGWWWPAADERARPVILRDVGAATARIAALAPAHDLIVQAGANVGVYPLALADHFKRVVTIEPDPTNYDCLERNLKARDSLGRILPFRGALGAAAGWCLPYPVERTNCGAHRVDFRPDGPVGVFTIDSLDLPACDVIWLDIEGPELLALQGAQATIQRFSPLIVFEDKGLAEAFQIAPGAVDRFLRDLGYDFLERIDNDSVYRRNP